jgi:hypothetical protein
MQLDGAGNSTSTNKSITISAVEPTNTAIPTITDGSSPNDGNTLHSAPGTWTANPAATLTRIWQRCATGGACTTIASQTGTAYTLTASDVGFKIRVVETATNDAGAPNAASLETVVVAPKTTGSPDLGLSSSPVADGVTLTASSPASDWDNAANLGLTYHFQRCNPGCTDVQATSSNTYTLKTVDVGTTYQVQVVAIAGPVDNTYSATAAETSSQTPVIAPDATLAPTITGTTEDTNTLTAKSPDSSWNGATGLTKTYVFSRCDVNGANCTVITSSTSPDYPLKGADLGARIRVTVFASISTSAAISSDPSSASAVIAPSLTTAPGAPTGPTKDGQTLTVTSGTWADSGLAGFGFQYQWVRCPSGGSCAPIPGAPSSTSYALKAADVGSTIKVNVTATFATAATQATTVATAAVQPQNTGVASITQPSPVADGSTFVASQGAWDGATGLDLGYQWKRCDSSGDGCSAIGGATGPNYIAGANDVGGTLVVTVSASAGGSATTGSGDSGHSSVVAPLSTGLADLSGAPQDTQTLTASSTASDWDGVTGLTTSYQFMRCNSTGGACAAIAGATSPTYVLTPADIGSTVLAFTFASKGGSVATRSGASPLTSIITPLLLGSPKASTVAVKDGVTLDASGVGTTQGTWADQSALSFRYEWFHCTPACTSLGAATTTPTYLLQPTDVGDTIQVIVTAFIGVGSASSTSTQTAAVAPLNTAASTIQTPATQQDGQVFTASDGGWDNATGLQFKYAWTRCDSAGANCSALSGATSKSYTSTPADVGSTLKVAVSAFKGASATTPSGASAATSVIAPLSTSAPQVSGTPMDGQTLTTPASTNASWDGTPATLGFGYQWLRCDTNGANCAAIAGATTSSYLLTDDDVAAAGDSTHARHKIEVRVSATVNGATTSSDSAATAAINAVDTSIAILPTVVGDAISNQELTANHGSWNGTDVQEVSYQWVRCDPPFTNCANIGAASLTGTTYLLQAADIGHYVSFVETVSNRLGTLTTQRAPFKNPVLSNALGATDSPVVSGSYVDGQTLSTTDGDWLPADNLTFTYSWHRCPPASDGTAPVDSNTCPAILHATSATYTLTSDDVGSFVVSQVRATYTLNGAEVTHSEEPSDLEGLTQVAASPPVNTGRPTLTGAAKQDSSLAASDGTWSGTNTAATPITFSYQWLRCDTGGNACQPISGATKAGYVAAAPDVGSRIAVRVTGSNSGGSASATSDATATIVGAPTPPAATNPGTDPGTGNGDGGGGGGAPHVVSTSVDKTAPKLVLTFVGTGTLTGGTTLSLNATCPKTEKSCTAKFQLLAVLKKTTGKAAPKAVTIASGSATLTSGQKKVVKLKLTTAARTALKKARKLKVTLDARVTDASGNVTPKQTKGFTLRWKKP